MHPNVLHRARGGYEALSCPPKPKLATDLKLLFFGLALTLAILSGFGRS